MRMEEKAMKVMNESLAEAILVCFDGVMKVSTELLIADFLMFL